MGYFVNPPEGQSKDVLKDAFAAVGIGEYKLSPVQNTAIVAQEITKTQRQGLEDRGCTVFEDVQFSTPRF